MRNIIFLDIDYVLNSTKFFNKQALDGKNTDNLEYGIDPECVDRLNQIICQLSNISIVISSSWRTEYSVDEFVDLFKKFGLNSNIIDITDENMDKSDSIKKWVKDNKIDKFVILDDDGLFSLSDKNHPLISTA